MTSQTLFLDAPLLEIFFTNSISFNRSAFFLGLQLGLDYNWGSLDILPSDF